MAFSFKNTPWITDLKNKKIPEEIQLQKKCFCKLGSVLHNVWHAAYFYQKVVIEKEFYQEFELQNIDP